MPSFAFIIVFAVSTHYGVSTSSVSLDGFTSKEKALIAVKDVILKLKGDSKVTILSKGVYEK